MGESEVVFIGEEAPEGGWQARALGESVFTQAESYDELRAMVRDAVACHFEDGNRPRFIRLYTVQSDVFAT